MTMLVWVLGFLSGVVVIAGLVLWRLESWRRAFLRMHCDRCPRPISRIGGLLALDEQGFLALTCLCAPCASYALEVAQNTEPPPWGYQERR